MNFEKDDIFTVTIDDMGAEGEGIGKVDGYTVFIKDAIIGDKVEAKIMKAKKNFGYARLIQILEPSPSRIDPKCQFHKQCGGCQIQAMEYDAQLVYKQNKVKNNLVRIGGFTQEKIDSIMEPIIGMENPYHYRNKAQFPIGTSKEGKPITGFYAGRTHFIIENTDCALGIEENEVILKEILAYMEEEQIPAYDEVTGKGIIRHVLIRKGFVTGEIMVCLVINSKKLFGEENLVNRLTKIKGMTSITASTNRENTNVIMGNQIRTIWGSDGITDYIKDVKFNISPLSFYQVNPVQTEILYDTALEYAGLTGKETVWDLYCGIGTISLFLAKAAKKVYGVEITPQSIEDAIENAKVNEITNAEFFVGKAEEVLPKKYEEGIRADVIVVDPPRKGCDDKTLETMLLMKPKKIVYVSCDSATLARDLKILFEGGYELVKLRAVDQFCHTVHVESVALLQLQ